MSDGFVLEIEARDKLGKAETRRLRRRGKVPAVLYGGGEASRAIMVENNLVSHQMEQEAFYTSILTLTQGSDKQAVIVKDVQRHPAKNRVLHLDFQRILADEKITLNVPIHFVGEEEAVGVKVQGGEITHLVTDVEVSCLPKDLPEFLELDITTLELNQLLHLSDLPVPEGVELTALAHDQDPAIVSISPPRREEEEETLEAEDGEVLEDGEADDDDAAEEASKDGDAPEKDSSD
jgi:large subunit ribosomal protein L25